MFFTQAFCTLNSLKFRNNNCSRLMEVWQGLVGLTLYLVTTTPNQKIHQVKKKVLSNWDGPKPRAHRINTGLGDKPLLTQFTKKWLVHELIYSPQRPRLRRLKHRWFKQIESRWINKRFQKRKFDTIHVLNYIKVLKIIYNNDKLNNLNPTLLGFGSGAPGCGNPVKFVNYFWTLAQRRPLNKLITDPSWAEDHTYYKVYTYLDSIRHYFTSLKKHSIQFFRHYKQLNLVTQNPSPLTSDLPLWDLPVRKHAMTLSALARPLEKRLLQFVQNLEWVKPLRNEDDYLPTTNWPFVASWKHHKLTACEINNPAFFNFNQKPLLAPYLWDEEVDVSDQFTGSLGQDPTDWAEPTSTLGAEELENLLLPYQGQYILTNILLLQHKWHATTAPREYLLHAGGEKGPEESMPIQQQPDNSTEATLEAGESDEDDTFDIGNILWNSVYIMHHNLRPSRSISEHLSFDFYRLLLKKSKSNTAVLVNHVHLWSDLQRSDRFGWFTKVHIHRDDYRFHNNKLITNLKQSIPKKIESVYSGVRNTTEQALLALDNNFATIVTPVPHLSNPTLPINQETPLKSRKSVPKPAIMELNQDSRGWTTITGTLDVNQSLFVYDMDELDDNEAPNETPYLRGWIKENAKAPLYRQLSATHDDHVGSSDGEEGMYDPSEISINTNLAPLQSLEFWDFLPYNTNSARSGIEYVFSPKRVSIPKLELTHKKGFVLKMRPAKIVAPFLSLTPNPNPNYPNLLTRSDWLKSVLDSVYWPEIKSKTTNTGQVVESGWARNVVKGNVQLAWDKLNIHHNSKESFSYTIVRVYKQIYNAVKSLPNKLRKGLQPTAFSIATFRLLVFKEINIWSEHLQHWYQKHTYKSQKRIFFALRRVLGQIFYAGFISMRFLGIFVQLKGKVASKGGMRKRLFRSFHGKFGSATLKTVFQYKFKQVWSRTGAIGLKVITMHRGFNDYPKVVGQKNLMSTSYSPTL